MKTKLLFISIITSLVFSSCMKDKNFKTYTIYRPEYSVKQSVKDNVTLKQAEPLKDLGSFVLYNNTMYINEKNRGIHIIDYTIPTSPINKGFIPIPGNKGLALKNNVLYADCFSDLFVFTIETNQTLHMDNAIKNVFPSRMGSQSYDSDYVNLTWIKKDTTVSVADYNNYMKNCNNCDSYLYTTSNNANSTNNNPMPTGGNSIGSSMAIFAIVNDYLYTVDNYNLNTFSLQNALNPVAANSQQVSWNVETLFPFKDKLFIGSNTGMFIYGLANPASPNYISRFEHVRVCDPVIADDKFAFVTLRSGSQCGGFTNQLDVLNIENIETPTLIKSVPFSNPHGLSKDGNVLFVCDGAAGLKMVNASDINNLQTKQSLPIGNAIDVIAFNQKAIVMLDNAIKIYAYDQQFNLNLLSSINKN
ncbi:LVIVD repeat-containing protein [Aurantibacillus circumpalustris]|uniref:LVIVD repeat-containing protein n=1 Tax=Aurantibacillus circumpalustris TaxID=3036359 RepID=UPI00295AA078|nr:hypothetical protein [Aurantibacillus circumpalustris]